MTLPEHHTFKHFETCASTMDEAFLWLKSSDATPEKTGVILADYQTKGRGRRGRAWENIKHNLTLSIAFKLPSDIKDFSLLSFVTAVALHDVMFDLCSGFSLQYKWPNDLLLEGKKVSGILIETDLVGAWRHMVVGIGVNLKVGPSLTLYPATSIYKVTGKEITPVAFVERLMPLFDKYKNLWLKKGFSEISDLWHKNAFRLNKEIHLMTHQGPVDGVLRGMDHRGHLVIQISSGERKSFSAGEILKGYMNEYETSKG